MLIRKLLNFPTKEQRLLINSDVDVILKKCDTIARSEYKDLKEAKKNHENICPHCQSKGDAIVNRIGLVKGSGTISGSFRNVNGTISIDTHEVKHCNVCTNEWKCYNIRYVSKTDIAGVALRYLITIINNPDEMKHKVKRDTIKVFDNCSAESIYSLVKKNKKRLTSDELKCYSVRLLRKHYASVFLIS